MSDKKIGIAVVLSALDKMSGTVNRAFSNAVRKANQMQERTGKLADKSFKAGKELTASGLAMGAPIYGAVDAAIKFETKMVDIRKQITALNDPKELAKMQASILGLGRELPIAIGDIQDLIAAGARMDIPNNQLVQYTRDVTKMSIAFDLAAGELGENMGKIAKVFNIPIQKVGEFADSINYLDDNAISKGGDIIDVLQRVGGVSKFLKPDQAAALASTLLTLGEAPERASTGINALVVKLSAADSLGKKARDTFHQMGLSTAAVQKGMTTNAQGTILQVLDRINRLPKEKQTGALKNIFGLEEIGKIAKLANSIDEYKRQLNMLNGQQKGSMDREYQKRIASTASRMQIAKNQATTLAVTLGNTLLPKLNSLLQKVIPIAHNIQVWMNKHPALTSFLMKTAAVTAGLALASGYLSFAFGGIFRMVSMGIKVFKVATSVIQGVSLAFRLLNTVFAMNVIVLVVLSIAASVFLLIKYWKPITAFFKRLWDSITKIFKLAWAVIKHVFLNYTPAGLIYKNWSKITGFFSKLWEGVKNIFWGVVTWLVGLHKRMFEAGANMIRSIWHGIKSMAHKPVEAVRAMVKKIRNLLPFSPAKEGPLMDIHKIKLVETIAASIRPDTLLQAMRRTLSTFGNSSQHPATVSGTGNAGGNITFHYNPTIQLSGTATQQDAQNLSMMGMKQFEKMMNEYQARKQRVSFG